jgi:hypothetical protein
LYEELRAKLESFTSAGGKLILGGTVALDGETGQFGLESIPVAYEGRAPTVPSYLRLDEALAGESELATDYDYVFYNRAHLVRPLEGAKARGELRSALFDRTWEHFTSHAQAPVGESLDSALVVERRVFYTSRRRSLRPTATTTTGSTGRSLYTRSAISCPGQS